MSSEPKHSCIATFSKSVKVIRRCVLLYVYIFTVLIRRGRLPAAAAAARGAPGPKLIHHSVQPCRPAAQPASGSHHCTRELYARHVAGSGWHPLALITV